ncbi:MAG: aldo/keto reductase [Thermotogae bacterium]|jgi:predicted aldo/keto reductase-like oxidoreductase|nr:aldo/keto reductase [Thermotogota bacterium]MCL5032801.1 aldo/keto reductase [Thermotogota bacterium]
MQKRILGKTKEKLSILGTGGIVVMNLEQDKANSIVADAIDRGVNYFDVAPSYGDAEIKLGNALKGKRDKVFLACKTGGRTKDDARKELEESLKRVGTDHFDLYQLHAMTTEEEFEKVIGPNGALETFVKAQREGLIRYIGFSAHSDKIAIKLIDAFDFDTILFPINWVLAFKENFGPAVIEKAREKNMGILAIKALALTTKPKNDDRHPKSWYTPIEDPKLEELSLRYTLSQPITAAIPPGDERLFPMALKIAENFTPITEEEIEYLRSRAMDLETIFQSNL